MNRESKFFLFGEAKNEHARGDMTCKGCRWDYPTECLCGGIIHIEYLDDIPNRGSTTDLFLYYCDRCQNNL